MPTVKPPASLEPRSGDESLTIEQLREISMFAELEKPIKLEEFPHTMVLRHYRRGDIICEQNDPGYTAFYLLTAQDLLELRQGQLRLAEAAGGDVRKWQAEVAELQARLASPAEEQIAPLAAFFRPAARSSQKGNLFTNLWQGLAGWAKPYQPAHSAPLVEGEIFGEMCCLYRQPRTATVRAERDCYVLEFLRHILDKMYGEKNFKKRMDERYRTRVLSFLLSRLPLFQGLGLEFLKALAAHAEFCEFEPGDLLFDEHDRADSMYIIRMGFVKVVTNGSSLLDVKSIADWPALCRALLGPAEAPAPAQQKIWKSLPPAVQELVRAGATGTDLNDEQKQELLYALNELLKQPALRNQAEFKPVVESAGLTAAAKHLPSGIKKWSQFQEVCAFNRKLLSAVLPGVLPALLTTEETGRLLSYRSQGDPIGEMGVVSGRPRNATCVAYVHHGEGKSIHGRVELVRIDRSLFRELAERSPEMGNRLAQLAEERLRQLDLRNQIPFWDDALPAALTERFDELGLIQGQHLMLIDLDRCTRCDQCVQACVDAHAEPWFSWLPRKPDPARDGRSRLFLDGPRFTFHDGAGLKNYLVPATCRQCEDAICLVGCPVGSIHRGDSGQIIIEDWCIGCSRCAMQCPYGSIQMHTVGLLPRRSDGWAYRRGATGPWLAGTSPFVFDRAFQEQCPATGEFEFRRSFTLSGKLCRESKSYRVEGLTLAPSAVILINGEEVVNDQSAAPRKVMGQREDRYTLECLLGLKSALGVKEFVPDAERRYVLREGANELTLRLTPPVKEGEVLLDAGLYAYSKPVVDSSLVDPNEYNQELVMSRAVVCDLCGGSPSCVHACPHDAAIRVEARSFFRQT